MFQLLLAYVTARVEDARDNDRGATAVEYGLLVALIAAIIVGVVGFLGIEVRDAFQAIVTALGGPAAA